MGHHHGNGTVTAITPARVKVIHVYKDFDIYNGLIETFMIMAERFDRRRYEFKVCVFNHQNGIFAKRFRDLGGTLDSLEAKWEDDPAIIFRLAAYLKRERPHIVQTYVLKPNLYGRIAARLAGVPVIVATELTLKDQAHTLPRRMRDLCLHPLNTWLNRWTDAVVCASEAIGRQWSDRHSREKIRVIYPPFDQAKIQQCVPARRPEGGAQHPWVIGIVGRLSEEKRHSDLLRAFARVASVFTEARLLIVGDGYLEGKLKKEVHSLRVADRVDFAGFQENVFPLLERMDVFVLPSRTEGLGIAILEAMAMGLPVVATNVGGIPEIVSDGVTGLLVPPGNPAALGESLIWLLADPERLRRMGEEGKRRVSGRFSPSRFIEAHEMIYDELLGARGGMYPPALVRQVPV